MDIISHALIGAALGELGTGPRRRVAWAALGGALPDIPQAIFLYPYVAWVHGHGFVPEHADWDGFRGLHPWASAIWEMPHSVFYWALVILPATWWLKLPRMFAVAYLSHIVADAFTHTGEWQLMPFWPLPVGVEGFCDPWRWTPLQWAISMGGCAAAWLVAHVAIGRRRL